MKKITSAFFILVLSASWGFSQGLSTNETVEYINSKFPDVFQIKVKKERELTIDFYKSGELYRTDRIYLPTLNPKKTKYNTEEKALSLYCLAEMPKGYKKFSDGCVERNFYQKKLIKAYMRSNIPVGNDEKTINGLIKAFNHLILISTDEGDYMGVDSFE